MTDRPLAGRFVLLGVTGSIAAYKSVELLRLLSAAGAEVQVMMTDAATHFVGPLTLETLSGRAVMRDPLELQADQRISHIVAADSADAIIVAPATARWLAAMAAGLADDAITATCLASSAPVVVAPAMDGDMYAHPATQANVARLREFGYRVVDPASGRLASGQVGVGRLAELPLLVEAVTAAVSGRPIRQPEPSQRPPRAGGGQEGDLAGWHIVVSAGGTAEPIDPVRFIGNRSSGRMGFAIAQAAQGRGARVTLIKGSTSVAPPEGVHVVPAETAAQMRSAVLEALPGADALVMAAAVADFRPREAATKKLARAEGLRLDLEPTADILAEAVQLARSLGEMKAAPGGGPAADGRRTVARRPIIVGFAAETGSLERAHEKAVRKGVDLLVANDVAEPGSGFGSETNHVTLIVPGQPAEEWAPASKLQVAQRLLDRLVALRDAAARPTGASLPA